MNEWTPINDHPGDQRYDAVPGTPSASYWGEIGPEGHESWSWTIVGTDDSANQWEADGGVVSTESDAKAKVESWTP